MSILHKELLSKTMNLSIMFVEDYRPFAKELSAVLEELFREVTVFENGKDALEYYSSFIEKKKKKIDIVLTDIMLPQLDGTTLCIEIRKLNPEQKIIVLSAYTETEDLITLINHNVDYFLKKPINYKEMCRMFYELGDKVSRLENTVEDSALFISLGHEYQWNRKRKCLLYKGKEIYCTSYELLLLTLLGGNKNMVFSMDQIMDYFIQQSISISAKRVRNLILQIRQKTYYEIVQNIYGEGYRLNAQ